MSYAAPLAVKGLIWLLGFAAVPAFALQMWLVVAAVPLTLMLFVWAPFRVWSNTEEKRKELEKRLTPAIRLEPVVEDIHQPSDSRERRACLKVFNEGAEHLRNCTGYVCSIEPDVLGRYYGVYLEWSPRDGGGKQIAIPREATLNVASAYGGNTSYQLNVHDPTLQYPTLFFGDEMILTILVSAENSASREQKFRLMVDSGGIVRDSDGRTTIYLGCPPDIIFEEIRDS